MKDTTSKPSKMEERKLLSMVDYILMIWKNRSGLDSSRFKDDSVKIFNYANFLQAELTISMFVPAILKDGKWEVLEIPPRWSDSWGHEKMIEVSKRNYEYVTALDNVIFEGFEVVEYDRENKTTIENDDFELCEFDYWMDDWVLTITNLNTIEDLTKYAPTLTETHYKKHFK